MQTNDECIQGGFFQLIKTIILIILIQHETAKMSQYANQIMNIFKMSFC